MLGIRTSLKRDKKRHRKMKASEIFSLRISELLTERGLSARKLGSMAGLSHNTIHRILTGKNAPSLDSAMDIAQVLGVNLSQLLGEAGKEHGLDECNRRVQAEWKKQRTKG